MANKYKWRDTRFMTIRVEPADAIVEIERVRKANGGVIRPPDVVEAAASGDSMIHDVFEWDNDVAAHKHRLWQARAMLRAIHVEIEKPETGSIVVAPVYVNINTGNDRHYAPINTVVRNPSMYQSAVKILMDKADELAKAVQTLIDYAPPGRQEKAKLVQQKAEELKGAAEGIE